MNIDFKNDKSIKVIAFYLPQFHAIPENDIAYGTGFTEWTNVKKARPLYKGHYQPREPLNDNYYNLLDSNVMKEQSELAKRNGIFGFCYYHYWFKNGKKLLEKPIENMLNDPSVEMPFCLSWANENWSKRWDGGNNEVIAEQEYGDKQDWNKHFDYLVKFFKDERYIKFDNKPIFIVYKPELIPNFRRMMNFFQKKAKEIGFDGLCVMCQYPNYYYINPKDNNVDYFIEFEPAFTRISNDMIRLSNTQRKKFIFRNRLKRIVFNENLKLLKKIIFKSRIVKSNSKKELEIRDYDEDWVNILDRRMENKMILGAFTDWDNTARNKNGLSYKGATPLKFGKYFNMLCNKVKKEKKLNLVFINAWNEWAEGAYLEPDKKNGDAYLQSVKNAIDN